MKRLQPRDVKIAARKGNAKIVNIPVVDGYPLSKFQRARIQAGVDVFNKFVQGRRVEELAEELGVTHQRVTQMTKIGLEFMLMRKCIIIRDETSRRFRVAA